MLSFYFQKITNGVRPASLSDARRLEEERDDSERKPTMTCRIESIVDGEGPVTLRISGQITGQEVDLLRDLLEQESRVPVLDLKDLLLVDRQAVKLLALRESNGVELRNCAAYIREWITRERVNGSASDQRLEGREDIEDA
jgi:hypothetical protein